MELLKENIVTIKEKKYIIIETLNYNYEKYAFANELTQNEDISESFYILKANENDLVIVTDEKIINILLEKFKNLINEDINVFLEKNNYLGG